MPSPRSAHQRRWPASLAVALVLVAQSLLPAHVSLGPPWLMPAVQAGLLAPLVATNPVLLRTDHPVLRTMAVALAISVMGFNAAVLLRLVVTLTRGINMAAPDLLLTVTILLVTNVVAAAVVFWEIDRGGPFARDPRHSRPADPPDLFFPQDSAAEKYFPHAWRPSFTDYLFVAFTLSTAFSPTDTFPLTARAKIVFMLGAGVSMTTFALVAARAASLI